MDWFATFLMTKFLLYAALFSRTYFNKVIVILLQVAKSFVTVQFFCVGSKIYLHGLPVTNILCQTKRGFAFSKAGFCADTKVFDEALNAVKFLGWLKKFGRAQNILEPVKGQGIGT